MFLGISDKSKVSQELLSLAGCLTDHLIHVIQVKSEKLALIAQIPPSFLEWLHNQVYAYIQIVVLCLCFCYCMYTVSINGLAIK